MQKDIKYLSIQDIMTERDRLGYMNPPDKESRDFTNGSILQKVKPGMVVKVMDEEDNICSAFILSIDRKTGTFCGLPVFNSAGKGRVHIEIGRSNFDYDGENANRTAIFRQAYIDTQHITTDRLDCIQGFDVNSEILYISYLEVLNKVIENFDYEGVVGRYEKYTEGIDYNKFSESVKTRKINLKQSSDAKTILIQNQQKQIAKLTSDIQTAKDYKDSSKQEIKNLKNDCNSLKEDLRKSTNEKQELVSQLEELTKTKSELDAKYHDVLEKYATATKDPKILEENKSLQDELTAQKETVESLNAEIKKLNEEIKLFRENEERTVEQNSMAESKLCISEDAIRQLSEKNKLCNDEIENYKTEILKKDRELEKLRKEIAKTAVNIKTEAELQMENEKLKAQLIDIQDAQDTAARPVKVYTLRPNIDTAEANITLPAVISRRLNKLLAPVPEEFRAAFLDEMIGYMEDSIKRGDVAINMLTRLTLN